MSTSLTAMDGRGFITLLVWATRPSQLLSWPMEPPSTALMTQRVRLPFTLAVYSAHESIARQLLQSRPNPSVHDKLGQTPPHNAVHSAHPNLLSILIEHGAEVNAPGVNGDTALHLSITMNDGQQTAEELVSLQASPTIENYTHQWPLYLAATRQNPRLIKTMIDNLPSDCDLMELLGWASEHQFSVTVEALFDRGAFVDGSGGSPLHWASSLGHTTTLELLLSPGVSINARDGDEWTPLHSAC